MLLIELEVSIQMHLNTFLKCKKQNKLPVFNGPLSYPNHLYDIFDRSVEVEYSCSN